MSFEDLEKQIKELFSNCVSTTTHVRKAKIYSEVIKSFPHKPKNFYRLFLWQRFKRVAMIFPLVGIIAFFGVSIAPIGNQTASAGKLEVSYGPVEIIRGKKSFLVKDDFSLQIGDQVKVGKNAQAKVRIPNKSVSTITPHTAFKITGNQEIFLTKGLIDYEVFQNSKVITDRGIIKSFPGANFIVMVSPSGETKVSTTKNQVKVFDLKDGEVLLNSGEEVVLRSDTHLKNKYIPADLKLSDTQIQAITSKLIIARSKILTGLEKLRNGDKLDYKNDITSGKRSFLSIAQVLKTSRELEIAKRKNIKSLSIGDIYREVEDPLVNFPLIKAEIKAVETFFIILDKNQKPFHFEETSNIPLNFNRYILVNEVFTHGTDSQQLHKEILLDKYVINFLRKIQNEELKIDQITLLNQEVQKLPKNNLAKDFLLKVQSKFAPDLALLLQEKINYQFN